MKLGQDAERLLVVAAVGELRGLADLVLHLLGVVHDEDGQDALRLDRLAIGIFTGAVDDDLGLLDRLHHGLLHGHHAGLLHTCRHVHGHSCSRVALVVNHHLLLVVALAARVVVALVGAAGFAVDDGRFAEELGGAHLAGHANLLDEASVHGGARLRVSLHRHGLAHVGLLLVLRLALVHSLAASVLLAAPSVDRLAQLHQAVGVGAVVLVWAGLAGVEVLADHSLVVFEALVLVRTARVVASLVAAAATSSATSSSAAHSLKVVTFGVHAAAHLTATARRSHSATATAAATHAATTILLVIAAALGSSIVRLVATCSLGAA